MRWQPLLSLGPTLFATCLIGSAVEFGWAAGEAVLVPYLSRHEIKQWVVSTIYLANPTLGLWVQPRLGSWSDKLNSRVPFVIGLGLLAITGIATLVSAIPLTRALGFGNDSFVFLTFVGFGTADICFDCLLIPGRALLDDITVPMRRSEEANAFYTGFQLVGRLFALLICSSSLTTSGLWGLYKDSSDAHFDACLTLSALYLIITMIAVVVIVDDRGSSFDIIPTDSGNDCDDNMGISLAGHAVYNGKDKISQSTLLLKTETKFNDCNSLSGNLSTTQQTQSQDASVVLCIVQSFGWIGICAQSFFWTSWRGEQVGCIDLALQGVVGMFTSGLLPFANAHFGPSAVWCCSEVVFHVLMASILFVPNTSYTPRVICALTGVNYAVHATNALLVASDLIPDPTKRAQTIAMVNNALPMGQLITAISGGAIAQYFGGFEYVFVCHGLFGTAVTSVAWIYATKQRLFSKPEVWEPQSRRNQSQQTME